MNKNTKIIVGIIIIIVAIWIGYFSFNKPIEQEAVKIGIILPLTGNQAAYGQGIQEGLEIALEEINNNMSRKINIIYEDNAGEIKNSVSAAQKLINIDKVTALITGVSQHSLAVAPIAEQNKIVLYAMASQASALDNAGDYVFKNDDNLSSLGKKAAQLIFELGYRKAGVIFATYNDATKDASKSFNKIFEELGGKVAISEGFPKDESDFRSYLIKINSQKPEVIFLNGLQKDSGLMLKQIKELNLKEKIFANGTVEDPQVIDVAKEAAEGVIFVTFQGMPTKEFIQKNQEKYNHYPLRWSMEAYDGLKIIGLALSKIPAKQSVNSDLLKEKLLTIKEYKGESGDIKFDDLGNAQRQIFIKIIKNGEFVKYEE